MTAASLEARVLRIQSTTTLLGIDAIGKAMLS